MFKTKIKYQLKKNLKKKLQFYQILKKQTNNGLK